MTHTKAPWKIEVGDYSGTNWLIGSLYLGYSEKAGKEIWIHITTDHIHASELAGSDAMDDAQLIIAALVRADIATVERANE